MFATGETLHFLGLSLLVGGILIVDSAHSWLPAEYPDALGALPSCHS